MRVKCMFVSQILYKNREVRNLFYVVPEVKTPLVVEHSLLGLIIVLFNLDSVCNAALSNLVATAE